MSELLDVNELSVEYPVAGHRRQRFTAVDKVSFSIAQGETLALVGESGSGKSTIGRAILGLAPVAGGRIAFEGGDVTFRSRRDQRRLARDLQVVFQDPYSSLNPAKKIGDILRQPLIAQGHMDDAQARVTIQAMLERVGLPADSATRYPAKFSGGQRQRIAIARALVLRPKLIICDEPTSALDVSTQATMLELLGELQQQLGLAYLFITHDLAVVRHFAQRVLVLRKGALVEQGTPAEVCDTPREQYTKQLVAAAPVPDPIVQRERRELRLAMAGGSELA
ncbi:ATP-binding cassette domain-containing protein [Microbacterium aerolatum]|uniref:ABC transporter ATP-binding protein n=1 Tax=Microbacterium aerolatum TaxID=153731 RepID=A0A511AKJ1_9MICO|nr:ATP-binding cassette domain-containing protein [Microbacterium aerolatum]GEK86417.1 ABC transporter ATP-binding protein [Microbacterium aerolatum]GGB22695.1 ABC transporter ATP-binding protein [Microbacterium aerolatum]